MAVQSIDMNHPFSEELEHKIKVLKVRLRLAKSALNSDLKDFLETGRIKGFGQRSEEWCREWIANQQSQVTELEQFIKLHEGWVRT